MKAIHEVKTLRVIEVKYLGATNTLGARARITQLKRRNNEPTRSITFHYTGPENVNQQVYNFLIEKGFKVDSIVNLPDKDLFLVDNWGDDYINLK